MYHKHVSITPTQQATNGALDLFVEGCRRHDSQKQLIGLTVLQSSTETQLQKAMLYVQSTQRLAYHEIATMFIGGEE